MPMTFKIHPAIGIARVGNSQEFCLSPEEPGGLPIQCDQATGLAKTTSGEEDRVTHFKEHGRVLRQGARFRVYAYRNDRDPGHEVAIGETIEFVNGIGQLVEAELVKISWTVYIANKKSSWYEFAQLDGEHGYSRAHPLRNAALTGADERLKLMIDPGPQTVDEETPRSRFARGQNPNHSQTFPPPLQPFSIDTLGEVVTKVDADEHSRLVVLGGFGRAGSYKRGPEDPIIRHYANNDGWFDDTSDGPVTAQLHYKILKIDGQVSSIQTRPGTYQVDVPAWVLVGYPAYAPEILDMITMDECVQDVFIRDLAYQIDMYGVEPFDGSQKSPRTAAELQLWRRQAQWNTDYYPYFWRDIWPILKRPEAFQWVLDFDPFTGGDPHNTTAGFGGNFDPEEIGVPPYHGQEPRQRQFFHDKRMFLYKVLRKPGQENLFTFTTAADKPNIRQYLMPYLCGDNPIQNTLPDKFLRLTETQLFLLQQWASGKFINEKIEHITPPEPPEAVRLDQGVLSNLLGGSFCPGAEAGWIMRNPALYAAPYRIQLSRDLDPKSLLPKAGSLSLNTDFEKGAEPGDITKYSAVPWQSDFNECSIQLVDITYENWNQIALDSTHDPASQVIQPTFWWPSHRPLEIFLEKGGQASWARGIPQSPLGDLMMVTAWSGLGFILFKSDSMNSRFIEVERNPNLTPEIPVANLETNATPDELPSV